MAAPSSGLTYNESLVVSRYTQDIADNDRSDGGFIDLAVQVNEFSKSGIGWIIIWHTKTTIPHHGNGKDTPLPRNPSAPVFAGEVKVTFTNDKLLVDRAEVAKGEPPYSAVHVPYIMIQRPFQNLRISPILWLSVTSMARANNDEQLEQWRQLKKSAKPPGLEDLVLNPEPPLGLVVVDLPDPELRNYWDKVGFNFLATQHARAWSFDDPEVKAQVMGVLSGDKKFLNDGVLGQVSPRLKIAPSAIKARPDYLEELAKDGIERGGWREVKMRDSKL
jgi:hypothetical protein